MNLQVTIGGLNGQSSVTITEVGDPAILAQWTHVTPATPIWISAITTAYLRHMRDRGASVQQIGMVVRAIAAQAGGIMAEINSETAFWLKQFGGGQR